MSIPYNRDIEIVACSIYQGRGVSVATAMTEARRVIAM